MALYGHILQYTRKVKTAAQGGVASTSTSIKFMRPPFQPCRATRHGYAWQGADKDLSVIFPNFHQGGLIGLDVYNGPNAVCVQCADDCRSRRQTGVLILLRLGDPSSKLPLWER